VVVRYKPRVSLTGAKPPKAMARGEAVKVRVTKKGNPLMNGGRVEWPKIKQLFLDANLSVNQADHITVATLADKHHLNVKTVQNRASKDGWYAELRETREKISGDITKALAESPEGVIAKLKSETFNDALQVRNRHLNLARSILVKAGARLREMKPEDLTVREALDFVRLGITEERRALGMIDETGLVLKSHEQAEKAREELSFTAANNVIGSIIDIMKEEDYEIEPALDEETENTAGNQF